MLRKLLGTAAVLVLASSALALAQPGVSGATPPPASGTVGCKISGSGKFAPKLTVPGSHPTVKIKFTATATGGCGGQAGAGGAVVNITGVTIKGVGVLTSLAPGNANSCANFTTADTIGTVKVKFSWVSSPAIAPTVVTYTGGTAPIVSGTPLATIRFPAAAGTTVAGTGSFTPSVNPVVNLATSIASPCAAGWGPYPAFTITAGSYITLP
jgi:hypothetical protein